MKSHMIVLSNDMGRIRKKSIIGILKILAWNILWVSTLQLTLNVGNLKLIMGKLTLRNVNIIDTATLISKLLESIL